jgi:hypothetical protein
LIQYFNARDNEAKTREAEAKARLIEMKKPFLERRLDFCLRATEDSAIIATSQDAKKVAKSKEDFLTLSSGPLVIVEDDNITQSANSLRNCIDEHHICKAPLKDLSSELAKDCSESLQTEWGVPRRPTAFRVNVQ